MNLTAVLGRPVHAVDPAGAARELRRDRVLITGALGSIGVPVTRLLDQEGVVNLPTDVHDLDVRDDEKVSVAVEDFEPTLIIHLAGHKYAPEGEIDPVSVLEVNGVGTANVLKAARRAGARVVLASTCKACNPETTYGASKLIAERMVLNSGGMVARFYNVVETAGNVFEIWAALAPDAPLPVTPCRRFFLSVHEVSALVLRSASLPSGRYTVNPGEPRWMTDVARSLYPDRDQLPIPQRKGDRLVEPRLADQETLVALDPPFERIVSTHDR